MRTETSQSLAAGLQNEPAHLLRILETVVDGVVIQDADRAITYANPAAEKILGVSLQEIQRVTGEDPPFSVTTVDGRPIPDGESPFVRVRDTREPIHDLELGVLQPTGNRIIVSANLSPLLSDDGAFLGTVVSFRDITRRSQLERELRRSNTELEQFAYVASHDLQEPLRMVSSYVQLLARRYKNELDDDANEFIGYAVDGAQRMQRLINDLLAFSRINSQGREFAPVDLEAVLQRVIRTLQPAIEESGATLRHDPLPTVDADEDQLEQLFRNLVSNSIKYRRPDVPLRIEIACEEQDAQWRFSFRDNGIGIAPEHHERVFLIFQRLHNRSEYSGTGIGLAICRRIIERHHGRIWIESTPDEGATVLFTLPLVQPEGAL